MNEFWNSQKKNEGAVKMKIEELRAKKKDTPLFKWLKNAKENKTEHTETDVQAKHTETDAKAGTSTTQPIPESDSSEVKGKISPNMLNIILIFETLILECFSCFSFKC